MPTTTQTPSALAAAIATKRTELLDAYRQQLEQQVEGLDGMRPDDGSTSAPDEHLVAELRQSLKGQIGACHVIGGLMMAVDDEKEKRRLLAETACGHLRDLARTAKILQTEIADCEQFYRLVVEQLPEPQS